MSNFFSYPTLGKWPYKLRNKYFNYVKQVKQFM